MYMYIYTYISIYLSIYMYIYKVLRGSNVDIYNCTPTGEGKIYTCHHMYYAMWAKQRTQIFKDTLVIIFIKYGTILQ